MWDELTIIRRIGIIASKSSAVMRFNAVGVMAGEGAAWLLSLHLGEQVFRWFFFAQPPPPPAAAAANMPNDALRALRAFSIENADDDDNPHAILLHQAAVRRFARELHAELIARYSRILFRALRRRVFQHRIRVRVRTKLVLSRSTVFQDLPADIAGAIATQWL